MSPSIAAHDTWLMIFYSVPSRPVGNRIKLWRKLSRAGAVQLKNAVYILPHSDEHYELFQWLISEVTSMGGDGAFVRVQKIETMDDGEVKELFNRLKAEGYRTIEKNLDDLERKISSIRKGAGSQGVRKLEDQYRKLSAEFAGAVKTDFFSSVAGENLKRRFRALEDEMKGITGKEAKDQTAGVPPCRIEEYLGKTWVTRKKPFVDRMASAWLIRKFIDAKAPFRFIDEQDAGNLNRDEISFDVRGGRFTHVGEFCTFEVLEKAFDIKTKPVKRIAEIVHELDMKDEKYEHPETDGIEEILMGIRKTAKDDAEALDKGMAVFEMLYASKM